MKFWARQVGCRTATREPGSLQRHHVCMCEHAYMCFSLFLPHPPGVVAISLLTPTFSAEVSWVLAPVARSWFLLSVYFLCALSFWQSDDVFCTSCYLSMHSCLSWFFLFFIFILFFFKFFFCWGRPWCQASLPVKTSWVVQNPCHLGWCYGQVTSSSLKPPVLFCIEHNWNSRCFWCENYEEMERMDV